MLGDVVGVGAYNAGRAKHVAGVTARGDTLTIRLTAPSATLPARLAGHLVLRRPADDADRGPGTERIPMAGPYYIASYVPERRLLLRRNPNYGGPGPLECVRSTSTSTSPHARGGRRRARARRLPSNVPLDRVGALERRIRARQRRGAGRAPAILQRPSADPERTSCSTPGGRCSPRTRMRRAVNFALDRRALARACPAAAVPAPGRPTDQFIPPGLPGFRDAAIYPLGGPDVERARRLAGDRRRRAVLYTCSRPRLRRAGGESPVATSRRSGSTSRSSMFPSTRCSPPQAPR